jgi:hypothetical protein
MRRRSRANSELAKARSRKAKTPRRRTTLAVRHSGSSASSQETEIARLISELNEALEEKTAISQLLRLVSTSSSNLGTVLQSVAERAAHICQAQFVDIFLVENDELHDAAWFGELKRTLHSSHQPRQLGDIRRDPPRLIFADQLGRGSSAGSVEQ